MILTSHSMSTVLSPVESEGEESPEERRGSRTYQIFPEANMNEELDLSSFPEDFQFRRERLPSIVVEPTEHNDLSWSARCTYSNNPEEEEESSTGAAVEAELQEDAGTEDGSVSRKSSIGPSQSQLSLSRLTPPASPTPPEAVPPCLRS